MLKRLMFWGATTWLIARWVRQMDTRYGERSNAQRHKPADIMEWEGEGGNLHPADPT